VDMPFLCETWLFAFALIFEFFGRRKIIFNQKQI
jgi:hypothetical protein